MKIIQRGKQKSDHVNRQNIQNYNSYHSSNYNNNGYAGQNHQTNGFKSNKNPYKSFEEREAAYQQARARIFEDRGTEIENSTNNASNEDTSSSVSGSHLRTNYNSYQSSNNRQSNFVPRVQSANPRPRYQPQNNYRQQQGFDVSAVSQAPGAYGTYPVMYNPSVMPYMYQPPDVNQQHQMSTIAPGGIYVDPYTGAQYMIAMPDYYDNTNGSNASHTGVEGTEEAQSDPPTNEFTVSANVSATGSSVRNTTASLPLQFGSLSLNDTLKNDSSAVVFKNMNQKKQPRA